MKVFRIDGKKNYSPAQFVISDNGEIYVDTAGDGFFRHPTITTERKLKNHLARMLFDGFNVTNKPDTSGYYAMRIDRYKDWEAAI